MSYISLQYNTFLLLMVIAYYIVPQKIRWIVLLIGSFVFYYLCAGKSFYIFICMILLSYCGGNLIQKVKNKVRWIKQCVFVLSILVVVLPLVLCKYRNFLLTPLLHGDIYWIVPLGISFFTMQMIAYLVDIYREQIEPQQNPFKYALFISFYPQILQGPIPRYTQLQDQLLKGHEFDENNISRGLHLIIWGFFLKLMIADKASVIVDTVFSQPDLYQGGYVLVAGVLYSIQLYADFLACVTLTQGAAKLMGIDIVDNFRHPYFSRTVKEFWGRWHISLSSWLKDYIYIPLGGNRKGKIRKYLNILVTFLVSGIWHGAGYKYLVWGGLHGLYQIMGDITGRGRERICEKIGFQKDGKALIYGQRFFTFLWVALAWILFRAKTLRVGIQMIMSLFTVYNPWIFFDDSIFELGLAWKEVVVLLVSIGIMVMVSVRQEKESVSEVILEQPLIIRWMIYIMAVLVIFVFGTYGTGFNAQDFIYGGF